jgi:hypothetical protein
MLITITIKKNSDIINNIIITILTVLLTNIHQVRKEGNNNYGCVGGRTMSQTTRTSNSSVKEGI